MLDENVMAVPYELLILGAAVKIGMIELLSEKKLNSRDLALELKADARAVWVIAEALAALGYLVKEEESYHLSAEARDRIYNSDAANYTGFAFMHRYNQIVSWLSLPEVILSGRPYPREREPENTAYFMSAMRYSARQSAQALAEYLLAGAGAGIRVLDLGGGPLAHARALTSCGARVTVLDLPEVVKKMKDEAAAAGIEMIPGDFNIALPPGPFELVLLSNICHIYGESENQALFLRVNQALAPGGRIAIVDIVRDTNPFAAVFGINMLACTLHGGTWTWPQYSSWLEAAGFGAAKLTEVNGKQLIIAEKNK
ncbi:MAG: Ribosomal protein L11 methyltransferase [Pelotomaculum sp. PtaB.Bin104]|nr:MAG: Ribosomal protein L11 methyltransferase [Pelotomaculum sp. PtaB.Bin104]